MLRRWCELALLGLLSLLYGKPVVAVMLEGVTYNVKGKMEKRDGVWNLTRLQISSPNNKPVTCEAVEPYDIEFPA